MRGASEPAFERTLVAGVRVWFRSGDANMRFDIAIMRCIVAVLAVCGGVASAAGAEAPAAPLDARQAEVRARGPEVMQFSLDATQHVFEKTPSGGTQRVRARDGRAEQVPLIRAHLQGIAHEFAARDFSGPSHIHGAGMPGLAELAAAPAEALTVTYRELDDGAELTYRAQTDALRDAVHRWFDAQLADHGHDATDHDASVQGGQGAK